MAYIRPHLVTQSEDLVHICEVIYSHVEVAFNNKCNNIKVNDNIKSTIA